MNLKLSTSGALAINFIANLGDAADSKTVLADKVAASYEKLLDTNDGNNRKRIFGWAKNLQGRLQKAVIGPSAYVDAKSSAANAVLIATGGKRPDVGILGKHSARELRPEDNSNLHHKKHVTGNLIANMIKKSASPDIGILGKSKLGRHRSRNSLVHEHQPPTKQITANEAPEEGDRYHGYDSYFSYYSVTNTSLCEEPSISGPRGSPTGTQGWIRQRQSVKNSSGTLLDDLTMPTCRCQDDQLSTCGSDLCNCLQNSEGDISSCMNEVNMLCANSTSLINTNGTEIEETLTMDQCTGNELSTASYCNMFPCVLAGGSYEQCMCDAMDHVCSTTGNTLYSVVTCMISSCCQGQTDDAGRLSCLTGAIGQPYSGYYGPYTPYGSYGSPSFIADYYECAASPSNSTAECACSILAPAYCELYNYSAYCDIQTCCQGQTDDAGKVDCFTSALYYGTPSFIADYYECAASPSNSTAECACSILAPAYCELYNYAAYCDIQTCCQGQTDDAGKVDCFTSAFYGTCVDSGYSKYFCLCETSSILCALDSDPKHCEVEQCCFYSSNGWDDEGHMKACLALDDGNHPSPAVTDPPEAGVFAKSSKAEAKTSKTNASSTANSKAEIKQRMNASVYSSKNQVQYEVMNGADKCHVLGFLCNALVVLIAWGWSQ
jgi:hypothetical protein